jgi:putative ubiquitin-RnfH superfamily antitoxin RatB of RatAB toxin-antitoxin module
MRIEVVYAGPAGQALVELEVPPGTTVAQAVRASGFAERFPGIDPALPAVGVFGERVSPERVLEDGERVEIYRPLVADPKEARKKKAARQKRRG